METDRKAIRWPAEKDALQVYWNQKLRVAAYCRVSTSVGSQPSSLKMQMIYYEDLIRSNPNWTLYKVYSDTGSGLNTRHRPGYLELLKDCRYHRIDLILVKSLHRFSRDTVEGLKAIRRLKELNVKLYSETEGLDATMADETLTAVLFAIAQEESNAKSQNIKFGIRQRMRSGKAILNHSQFLGYTKGEDGQLAVVPEEAEIVRKIFELYLDGNGVRKIKRYLEEHDIKTVTGKSEWSTSTIDRMLSNEKYAGHLLLQKTYTPDFLTGKQHKNDGQRDQYLIRNAHEAIIDEEAFKMVQEMKSKKKGTCHESVL